MVILSFFYPLCQCCVEIVLKNSCISWKFPLTFIKRWQYFFIQTFCLICVCERNISKLFSAQGVGLGFGAAINLITLLFDFVFGLEGPGKLSPINKPLNSNLNLSNFLDWISVSPVTKQNIQKMQMEKGIRDERGNETTDEDIDSDSDIFDDEGECHFTRSWWVQWRWWKWLKKWQNTTSSQLQNWKQCTTYLTRRFYGNSDWYMYSKRKVKGTNILA